LRCINMRLRFQQIFEITNKLTISEIRNATTTTTTTTTTVIIITTVIVITTITTITIASLTHFSYFFCCTFFFINFSCCLQILELSNEDSQNQQQPLQQPLQQQRQMRMHNEANNPLTGQQRASNAAWLQKLGAMGALDTENGFGRY